MKLNIWLLLFLISINSACSDNLELDEVDVTNGRYFVYQNNIFWLQYLSMFNEVSQEDSIKSNTVFPGYNSGIIDDSIMHIIIEKATHQKRSIRRKSIDWSNTACPAPKQSLIFRSSMNSSDRSLYNKCKIKILPPTSITGDGRRYSARRKEAIHNVLKRKADVLKHYYYKELKKNPKIAAKMNIKMQIDARGKVFKCIVLKSSFNNPEFERFVSRIIKRWNFEELNITVPYEMFPDLGTVTVTFPIKFYLNK